MMVATRSFPIRYDGQDDEILAGKSRCAPDHPLVRQYPDAWREEGLEDELRIRSERVAEINDTTRVTKYEPQSAAGRRERDELRFWDGVDRMLTRDDRSPEERTEQAFYDRALAQIEEGDSRELAEVNATAVRDFGFDRGGWSRRTAG